MTERYSRLRRRIPCVLGVVLVVLGAGLRVRLLLAAPALWIDEAMLALSVASRTFSGLVLRLDYGQVAPVGFLWAEKLAVEFMGVSDLALRMVPFTAGVALVAAIFWLSRHLLSPSAFILATGMAAFSPLLLHYSREVKPYMVDALVTALLCATAIKLAGSLHSTRRWWLFTLMVFLAIGGSVSGILVTVGAIFGLVFQPELRRSPRLLLRLAVVAVVAGLMFTLLYFGIYRSAAASEYMQQYWGPSFLGLKATQMPRRLWEAAYKTFRGILIARASGFPGGQLASLWAGWLVLACLVLGGCGTLYLFRRRDLTTALILTAPVAATLGASALNQYPLSVRLLLFLVPVAFVLMAAGVEAVVRWTPDRARPWAAGLLASVLLVPSAVGSLDWLLHPPRWKDAHPVLAEFRQLASSDEPVYVAARGLPIWVFYTTRWHAPDRPRLSRVNRLASPGGPAFANSVFRGRPEEGGEDLAAVHAGRLELIGLAPGMQWREGSGFARDQPEPEWSRTEATRIRAAASPCIWSVFLYPVDGTDTVLLSELEREEMRRELDFAAGGAALYRHCDSHIVAKPATR